MPGPFTTPVALSTPFEPMRDPGFGGLPQPFISTDVQNAIEEGLNLAIGNDRFILLTHYGGNANTGRYTEWYTQEPSDVSPITLSAPSKLLNITCQTTAAQATCTIGLFDLNISSTIPLYTVVMSNEKRVTYSGTASVPLASIASNSLLALRVTSGSINTPELQVTLSSLI